MASPQGALKLVDFGSSLFWTLAGVVSVGITVTAINQRVRAQVGAGRAWGGGGARGRARRAAPGSRGGEAARALHAARAAPPHRAPRAPTPAAAAPHSPPLAAPQEEQLELLRQRNAVIAELLRWAGAASRAPAARPQQRRRPRPRPRLLAGAPVPHQVSFPHGCCEASITRLSVARHWPPAPAARAPREEEAAGELRAHLQRLERQLEAAGGVWWGPAAEQIARTLRRGPACCGDDVAARSSGGGGGGGSGSGAEADSRQREPQAAAAAASRSGRSNSSAGG
jgi:hypothetical protein